MQVTSIPPLCSMPFEKAPKEILLNIFSRVSDLKTYQCIRLINHRFSTFFLEKHMNFTENEQKKAIFLASKKGLHKIVARLLKNPKVNPTAQDHLPLIIACQNGHVKVVQLLLKDSRIDPSPGSNTPLILASQNGHLKIVKLLLAHSRLNLSADHKNFVLMVAKTNGRANIIKCLKNDQP